MVGRNAIELACQGQPLLAELGLVPVGVAHDQFAGFRPRGGSADRG
jgi:hypothetical protein